MTEVANPRLPAFDPAVVSETNFTSYPEPHRAVNSTRYYRRLGDHAGLHNFGVNLTRIVPGGQSSYRHAHSRQDEFIYVLEGRPTLVTNSGETLLEPREGSLRLRAGPRGEPLSPNAGEHARVDVGDERPLSAHQRCGD